MQGKTHMLGGLTAATAASAFFGLYSPHTISDLVPLSVFGACSIFGALVPDIDTKQSKISHKNKFVSFWVRLLFTHRGFTHSALSLFLFIALVFGISRYLPFAYQNPVLYGCFLGYVSHLLLDSLNPKGIMFFYPFKVRVSVGPIVTGGLFEKIFAFALLVFNVICVYNLVGNIVSLR